MTHKEFFPYSSSPLQSTMYPTHPRTHKLDATFAAPLVDNGGHRATTKASVQWLRRGGARRPP